MENTPIKQKEVKKSRTPSSLSLFTFRLKREALEQQLDGYYTLKFHNTARGATVIAVGIFVLLSALSNFYLDPVSDVYSRLGILIGILFYLAFAFLVYEGHKWASVALMLLLSFDLSTAIIAELDITAFAAWVVLMSLFTSSYQVESAGLRLREAGRADKLAKLSPKAHEAGSSYVKRCRSLRVVFYFGVGISGILAILILSIVVDNETLGGAVADTRVE